MVTLSLSLRSIFDAIGTKAGHGGVAKVEDEDHLHARPCVKIRADDQAAPLSWDECHVIQFLPFLT